MSAASRTGAVPGADASLLERWGHRRRPLRAALLALALVVLAGCIPMRNDQASRPEPRRPLRTPARIERAPTPTPMPAPTFTPTPTPTPSRTPLEARENALGPGIVGFVGCSVTRDAIQGYYQVGGERIWPFYGISYGGASIGKWSRAIGMNSGHWRDFHALLAANPGTKVLWLELCTSRSAPVDSYENAVLLIEEFGRLIPGVEIYVSAQPDYVDHVCGISGQAGPADMQRIVDQLVAGGHAYRGPVVGPLAQNETIDGCHGNDPGNALMGEQLVEFFGAQGTDGATATPAEGGRPGEAPAPGPAPAPTADPTPAPTQTQEQTVT